MAKIYYGKRFLREFEKILDFHAQNKIQDAINKLQMYGNNYGYPFQKPLVGELKGLWELRPMPYRIIYFPVRDVIFVLGILYIKQSDDMPMRERRRCMNFLREMLVWERQMKLKNP